MIDIVKDIIYILLYPHLDYWWTLILTMSLLGPVSFIYVDKRLGSFQIIRTLEIFVGHEDI